MNRLNFYRHIFFIKSNNEISKFIAILSLLLFVNLEMPASPGYWRVTTLNNPSPGYLKFYWLSNRHFSLWDNYGKEIYIDSSYININLQNFKMLPSGLWIANGSPVPGINKYYMLGQDMEIVDSIPLSNSLIHDFHDVIQLSNGHFLVLYMNNQIVDMSKLVEGGNPNAVVLNSILVETDRTGTVYWSWNALDHMNVLDITSGIDLRSAVIDFPHANSFCEDTDGNIIVSFRYADEISKINKQTGNFVWRMGGSHCVNNQFNFTNDNFNGFFGFSHQHSVSMLPNGNILIYDNGNKKEPKYSRAVEYSYNTENKTVTKEWEYRYTPDVFVGSMGSAVRLPSGNTLINWGQNRITEVTPDKQIAFEMVWEPGSDELAGVYRAFRYVTKMDAVSKSITGQGDYIFANSVYNTDITLSISSLSDTGTVSIEKHYYGPPSGAYNDSGFTNVLPYRWVASSKDINSIAGTIAISASGFQGLSNPKSLRIYKRGKETEGVFTKLTTTYNSQTKKIYATYNGLGEFVITYFHFPKPQLFYPADKDSTFYINDTIKWHKINKADNYQLQISGNSNFTSLLLNQNNIGDTVFKVSGLLYDTKYYCRLRAYNSSDTSEWSDTISFYTIKIPKVILSFPANGSVGFMPDESFSWKPVEGLTDYSLQFALDTSFNNIVYQAGVSDTQFIYNDFDNHKKYYWRVRGRQSEKYGPWPQTWSFVTKISEPVLISPKKDSLILPYSITFEWDTAEGAKSYKLQVSERSDFATFFAYNSSCQQPKFQYKDFLPNKAYFWRVAANGNKDTSMWSDVYSFTTLKIPPTLITPVNNYSTPINSISFKWDSIATAVSYHFLITCDSLNGEKLIDIEGMNQSGYIYDKFDFNKEYFWKVRAKYTDGYGDWSEPRKITIGNKQDLALPKLLYPANKSQSYVHGTLSWQRILPAVGYDLQIAESSDFSQLTAADYAVTDTFYYFQGLDYSRKYYWRVRCFTSQDTSKWTNAFSFVTQDPSPKLVYPENNIRQLPCEIAFKWQKAFEAESYQVQISTKPGFNTLIADSSGITDTVAIIGGLQPNTDYYWRSRYFKKNSWHQWSGPNIFTTAAQALLPAPKIKYPAMSDKGIPIKCALSWDAVDGAEYYSLSVSGDGLFESTVISEQNLSKNEYPVNLDYNKNYYWRVSAGSSKAGSPWSKTYNFLTALQPLAGLYPPDGKQVHSNEGVIGWNRASDKTTYRLQISVDSGFNTLAADLQGIADTCYKYHLESGMKYYWRVRAENDINYSEWSPAFSLTVVTPDFINDENVSCWLVAPLPANDFITVKNTNIIENGHFRITVFDALGENLLETETMGGVCYLSITGFAPGVYFLVIETETKSSVYKTFIKY